MKYPTDRAQIADEKNGVICLVMFTPQVMVTKMSKMAHFHFLLMPTKNQKTLFRSLRKSYGLLDSELPLVRHQTLKI